MLNWIIEASLAHRKLVILLSLALVVTGLFSLRQLSFDAFPDVTDVMVQVNTIAPSLSPVEIEQQISAKIEQVMGGLPNLNLVRSMSKFGLSQVTLVFEDGTDVYFARSQVLERLQSVELPEGLERPTMGPVATGALSDALEPRYGDDSLRYALLIVSFVLIWSSVHFWLAARTLEADLQRARVASEREAGAV